MHKNNILEEYNTNGYIIIDDILESNSCNLLCQDLEKQILSYSQDLSSSFSNYTYCTGRWGNKSAFFKMSIFERINSKLQYDLEMLFNSKLSIQKQNIICKNEFVTDSMALHQDISYSFAAPYNFTLWLSLNDVHKGNGELILIPGSHKWPISKAVDFWSPFFKDKKLSSYRAKLKKIYLKAGSCIIFNSRLWHGSSENINKAKRYAYVTRWLVQDFKFPTIPHPIPLNFGMWNCSHQLTEALIRFTGLGDKASFEDLILITKNKLSDKNNLIDKEVNPSGAIKA